MGSDTAGGAGARTGMDGRSMKRMHMMGRMAGVDESRSMVALSRLPGFPGASHIYHIGASGFFLDHGALVDLSMEQRKQLAQVQEQSVLEQASFDRSIDQAEQERWVLTSAGEPEAASVEEKVRHIADLSAEQRLSFIRSVGEAAALLAEEQRRILVGDLGAAFEAHGGGDTSSAHDH